MISADLNGKIMANKMRIAESTISRLLSGNVELPEVEIATFLALCGVAGKQRNEILGLWYGNHTPELFRVRGEKRWATYREHAIAATRLIEWAPFMVPWMFQMTDYAKSAIGASGQMSAGQIDELVSTRTRLAKLVTSSTAPSLIAYLHESMLRVPFAAKSVMAEQVHHLLQVSVKPFVSLRIVPIDSGASVGLTGAFAMLHGEDHLTNPTAYQDGPSFGVFHEGSNEIVAYEAIAYQLSVVALSKNESRALLRNLAVEVYGDGIEAGVVIPNEASRNRVSH
jgi:hypothetical protein